MQKTVFFSVYYKGNNTWRNTHIDNSQNQIDNQLAADF